MVTASFVCRAAVLSLCCLALAACGDDDATEPGTQEPGTGDLAAHEWPAFYTLPELVDASDIIVVAQLGEETTHTIDAPAVDGQGETTVIEIVRTFVVDEPIKGDLVAGDLFNVFNTASIATESPDGPTENVFQVLEVHEDQSYLLFLNLIDVPDYYPDELGAFGWAAPGEPHTARVEDDGTLLWETTGRYDDAREERNIPPGEQGAGPTFDVTIEMVAALSGQGGGAIPIPDGSPAASATP